MQLVAIQTFTCGATPMKTTKRLLSTFVAGSLLIASMGLSATAFALNTNQKRGEGVKLEWVTPDVNHPVVAYRVFDKLSSSYVSIHVDTSCNGKPSSSITVNGCGSENNLSLMPGETFECLVKSTAALTAVSNNADTACGFAQFLSKGPK